jgi:hypothetical protein
MPLKFSLIRLNMIQKLDFITVQSVVKNSSSVQNWKIICINIPPIRQRPILRLMKILNYNLYTKTYFYQRGNRVGTHNIACRCYKPLQSNFRDYQKISSKHSMSMKTISFESDDCRAFEVLSW